MHNQIDNSVAGMYARKIIAANDIQSAMLVRDDIKSLYHDKLDKASLLNYHLLMIFALERMGQFIDSVDLNIYLQSNGHFEEAHALSTELGIDLRVGTEFYQGMVLCKFILQGLSRKKADRAKYFNDALEIAKYCIEIIRGPEGEIFNRIINAT